MNPTYKFHLWLSTTPNILNPGKGVSGFYVSARTGELVADSTNTTSEYIPVSYNKRYYFKGRNVSDARIVSYAFYDANKIFVEGDTDVYDLIAEDSTIKYVRISVNGDSLYPYSLTDNQSLPYIPYYYRVYPLFKDDLALTYEREQNQMFFRPKLDGKLQFVGVDFDTINNASFETQFELTIYVSWDAGQTWSEYWNGEFWKTDCNFNLDSRVVEVSVAPIDGYTQVLAGLEKEYNLITLKPEIEHITVAKRPLIQVYIPGDNVISCFLSGMYWEQDCNEVSNETQLLNTYYFSRISSSVFRVVENAGAADGVYVSNVREDGRYRLTAHIEQGEWIPIEERYEQFNVIELGSRYQRRDETGGSTTPEIYDTKFDLYEVGGSGIAHVGAIETHNVYARLLCDVQAILGEPTHVIPREDIVENNRNYHRVIRYNFSDLITYSSEKTSEPTEWGIFQPGIYYKAPSPTIFHYVWYPVGRSRWGIVSVWFKFSDADPVVEVAGRKEYTLRDANPIASVISVLLGKIAPGVTHEATEDYSKFLYSGGNPLTGDVFNLFLTQKSNILAGDYSQPAQNAPITLKVVTDMLRDCFQCYWFIEGGKFKIEHILWFKNGGSYNGTPGVSVDLTRLQNTRNGKRWAFGVDKFNYEKVTMPERYQFGWMDEVSLPFRGYPIQVNSRFVSEGNIEEVNVTEVTSDVDYMLLNPGACSQDGFALLAARKVDGENVLPFVTMELANVEYVLQNGLVSFFHLLPSYYVYNLPSYDVTINEESARVFGITRNKTQDVVFPVKENIDLMKLIKTNIGNGQIEKITITLSSRKAEATLKFDTYENN